MVARPLFSSVVKRLRAAGHGARVAARSTEPSREGHGAFEVVELRVRLRIDGPYAIEYRTTGYLRLTMSGDGRWGIDMMPRPEGSGIRHDQRAAPKIDEMATDQLEAQILAFLERLRSREY